MGAFATRNAQPFLQVWFPFGSLLVPFPFSCQRPFNRPPWTFARSRPRRPLRFSFCSGACARRLGAPLPLWSLWCIPLFSNVTLPRVCAFRGARLLAARGGHGFCGASGAPGGLPQARRPRAFMPAWRRLRLHAYQKTRHCDVSRAHDAAPRAPATSVGPTRARGPATSAALATSVWPATSVAPTTSCRSSNVSLADDVSRPRDVSRAAFSVAPPSSAARATLANDVTRACDVSGDPRCFLPLRLFFAV